MYGKSRVGKLAHSIYSVLKVIARLSSERSGESIRCLCHMIQGRGWRERMWEPRMLSAEDTLRSTHCYMCVVSTLLCI